MSPEKSDESNPTIANTQQHGYPNVAQSFGLLGIMLLAAIAVSLTNYLLKFALPANITSRLTYALLEGAINYALTFYITVRIGQKEKARIEGIHFDWFKRGNIRSFDLLVLALLTLFFCFATEPVYQIIPSVDWLDKPIYEEFKKLIKPHILSFISVSVLPAIFEEALMRGIILDGLLKRYKPWKAIIISSLLFGLMHLNPLQFVAGLMAGLFLGWVYWKTKSLLACMIIHATNNAVGFFLALRFGFDATTVQLVGKIPYVTIAVVSTLLFISGIVWLSARWTNKKLD